MDTNTEKNIVKIGLMVSLPLGCLVLTSGNTGKQPFQIIGPSSKKPTPREPSSTEITPPNFKTPAF